MWNAESLFVSGFFGSSNRDSGRAFGVEAPEQSLNRNQQKMLSEMMVLYEAVDGIVAITKSDSPYFQINQVETLPQTDHRD